MKLHKVRITVLRRLKTSEVFEKIPVTPVSPMKECGMFKDGQEFVVDGMKMPDGFCPSAWVSIYSNVRLLECGGNLPWYKEEGVAINCCTDGLRPVIFKLERV